MPFSQLSAPILVWLFGTQVFAIEIGYPADDDEAESKARSELQRSLTSCYTRGMDFSEWDEARKAWLARLVDELAAETWIITETQAEQEVLELSADEEFIRLCSDELEARGADGLFLVPPGLVPATPALVGGAPRACRTAN
jgi:hypothetical protein